jgi:hypothetical protein
MRPTYHSEVPREVWEQLDKLTRKRWPTFEAGDFTWDSFSAVLHRLRYEEVIIEPFGCDKNVKYMSNASSERLDEVLMKAMLVLS